MLEKYPDYEDYEIVHWATQGTGEGCDYKILQNHEEIAYYEIKTRQNDKENSIEIKKSQWDFATALYEKGEGEKYTILVVTLSTGKIKPFINPVKLWKDERKLQAQPLELSWEDEDNTP
ncbi:MAG: protein NO VEIN domain-containing protein [Cyanobacteriota bacterium]